MMVTEVSQLRSAQDAMGCMRSLHPLSVRNLSGSEAAKYAATAVHEVLAKNKAYKEGNYAQALKEAFLNADEGFYNGVLRSVELSRYALYSPILRLPCFMLRS